MIKVGPVPVQSDGLPSQPPPQVQPQPPPPLQAEPQSPPPAQLQTPPSSSVPVVNANPAPAQGLPAVNHPEQDNGLLCKCHDRTPSSTFLNTNRFILLLVENRSVKMLTFKQHQQQQRIYFHLVWLVKCTKMTESLNSRWTPEITLRTNLVGCPLYWKLNVKLSGKYN